MVALRFNATTVKPNVGFEPVPTGMYPVMIVRSEEKPTKSGTGAYIELEMQIQASPHTPAEHHGKKVFDRLNIKNPNQVAVDIAYGTLSAICHVTGVLDMQDTQQLHGKPFVAIVKKEQRDDQDHLSPDQRGWTNRVTGYKDINGNDPGFGGTVSNAAAQPGWAGGNANPATAQQPQVTQQAQQPVTEQAQTTQQVQPQQEQAAATTAPTEDVPSWARKNS